MHGQASTRIVTSCEEDDSSVESEKSFIDSHLDLFYDAGSDQRDEQYMKEMYLENSNTDAKLNCPCCFQIVCVDCQKHEKYNVYRAMFVTNITVDWNVRLRYDPQRNCLVTCSSSDKKEPPDDAYYMVCCGNCQTTVAALDMKEEIYYFSGCLAS